MGYRKIPNLYIPEASNAILPLEEVIVMEKIHGTSAHWRFIKVNGEWELKLFSGGVKHCDFEAMLDERFGLAKTTELFRKAASGLEAVEVTFYGEAYGGKCQRMSHIYGPLNFIVFEVRIDNGVDDWWLTVPKAEAWAKKLELPFVWWTKGKPDVEWLNTMRDRPSEQAKRNLGLTDAIGEGVVIRSVDESYRDKFGNRIIAKHKTEKFSEHKKPREVDPNKAAKLKEAQAIAENWVTPMRLEHVLDAMKAEGIEPTIQVTKNVIGAMLKDVRIEAGVGGEHPEIEWNKGVQKAIARLTSGLFRKWLETSVG